ncbi:MAG: hypothetical protein NT004_01635 [Bacteroidetes bacterium]|nr:hypothetical protein [Bacteroidota bacterium]
MAIIDLAIKYNANTKWDSTGLFTVHYQEMFIDEKQPMLFRGRIYDIVKVDSCYVVQILDEREDADHNFLASVTITPQQFKEIYSGNKSTIGVFIIKVSKVTSSNPSIKADVKTVEAGEDRYGNSYTEDVSYTFMSDDEDRIITIFKGKLLDMRLVEI